MMSLQCQYVVGLHRDEIQQKADVATISCAHWVIKRNLKANFLILQIDFLKIIWSLTRQMLLC